MSGPDCKRVKFSDILDEAATELPPVVSSTALSQAIREEFPNSVSRRVGDKRYTYVYGIDKDEDPQSLLELTLKRNRDLEREVQELKQKVVQLEQESAHAQNSDDQMQSLLRPDRLCYHGPDTIEHLESFSLDAIIIEFSATAPDVMELVRQLGNCSRHDNSDAGDELSRIATLRSTMALCTLVKCRSVKVLGLQLFLAIMLIARATNKQVWKVNINNGMSLNINVIGDNSAQPCWSMCFIHYNMEVSETTDN